MGARCASPCEREMRTPAPKYAAPPGRQYGPPPRGFPRAKEAGHPWRRELIPPPRRRRRCDGTRARRSRWTKPPPTSPPQRRDKATAHEDGLNRDLLAFVGV